MVTRAARSIRLGTGDLLTDVLREENKTLRDLARRTEMLGQPGWAGVEEAAVLAHGLNVQIEIYEVNRRRYKLWAKASCQWFHGDRQSVWCHGCAMAARRAKRAAQCGSVAPVCGLMVVPALCRCGACRRASPPTA